jgi:hypothetical protein
MEGGAVARVVGTLGLRGVRCVEARRPTSGFSIRKEVRMADENEQEQQQGSDDRDGQSGRATGGDTTSRSSGDHFGTGGLSPDADRDLVASGTVPSMGSGASGGGYGTEFGGGSGEWGNRSGSGSGGEGESDMDGDIDEESAGSVRTNG